MLLVGSMKMDKSHPLAHLLEGKRIVLGSESPRRIEILSQLGLPFECRPSHAPEDHDKYTKAEDVPQLLAHRKAEYLRSTLAPNELLITADTIVILGEEIIEKPKNLADAKCFLEKLSGQWHKVITGYCILSHDKEYQASVESSIRFAELHPDEIEYYITRYQVLDKAGAYGIQDWIGLIGVAEIRGSYHNVMGLPSAHLYSNLKKFLSWNKTVEISESKNFDQTSGANCPY